ncbi:MAG: hypothetical protein GF308_06475 [Candidatus Heimdallarchaeota archaeon]|nr:hypothetical protein [Candidatus Heimdallarchaeota archaeon]
MNRRQLEKIGIVCGFGAVVFFIVLQFSSLLIQLQLPSEELDTLLTYYQNHMSLMIANSIFGYLSAIFLVPGFLVIYQYVKKTGQVQGNILWIPLVFVLIGSVVFFGIYIIQLNIVLNFAAEYSATSSTMALSDSTINLINNLQLTSKILSICANIFILTLGTGLFSMMTYRTRVYPRQFSSTGITAGFLAFTIFGTLITQGIWKYIFSFLNTIAIVTFISWIVSISIYILRHPRTPSSDL